MILRFSGKSVEILKVKSSDMKTNQIIQAALLITVVAVITSCETEWGNYHHRYVAPQTSFSLIISPRPGLLINSYPDGRYYYRSPEGYVYWRGDDDRYYLDRKYINRGHYNRHEYEEWSHNERKRERHDRD